MDDDRFDTRAVDESVEWDHGDVVTPIHLSSTYQLPGVRPEKSLESYAPDDGEYIYSRISNPTRHAVEQQLADLEGGEMGFAFSSGMAAIATGVFSVLDRDERIVAFDDIYAGTLQLFDDFLDAKLGFDVEYVDATDPENVRKALSEDVGILWLETPTNPMIQLCDIDALSNIAHEYGAVVGVDNTFASPYFQQPLSLGADFVTHSTTKYLNGHSDGVGGALVTDDPEVAEAVEFLQQVPLGNQMQPFDAYLVSRGIKTLGVRMRQHESNALALARYLADNDLVTRVSYPGLESHPQHDLACEQMDGFGGVLAFEIDGGVEASRRFADALETMTVAVSLGGVETLVNHPATMTHEPLDEAHRREFGITDGTFRLSVGIEDIADLKADIDRGLDAVGAAESTR